MAELDRLLDQVVPTLPASPGADRRLDVLTDREREVLIEIAAGATNAEIATRLYMAEGTVKTHIGRLLAKLRRLFGRAGLERDEVNILRGILSATQKPTRHGRQD